MRFKTLLFAVPMLALAACSLAACAARPGDDPPADAPAPASGGSAPTAAFPDSAGPVGNPMVIERGGMASPVLSTAQGSDGVIVTVSFRTSSGVTVSDEAPLRLRIGDRRVKAALRSGPARFTEPGGAVVDQATYLLAKQSYFDLVATAPSDVSVEVHDGATYVAYPYVSGDLIE